MYYFDTSALVKLYIEEQGTELLLELLDDPGQHQFAILSLSQVELRSALRRRESDGDLDGPVVAAVLEQFSLEMRTRFLNQPVSDAVLELAGQLLDHYVLGAYDGLQLAGCLSLHAADGGPVFVSADRGLLDAAEQENLEVLGLLN